MDNQSLKQLLEKLNGHCAQALEVSAGFAASRGHFEVNSAHLLIKLMEDDNVGDIERVLSFFKVDIDRLWHALINYLNDQPAGSHSKPAFGRELYQWLEQSWLATSLHYGADEIRSVALVDALTEHAGHFGSIDIIDCLSAINLNALRQNYQEICQGSIESKSAKTQPKAHSTDSGGNQADTVLAQYTQDLTEKAKSADVDPVLGRNDEIRMMIDVLCRRRKNNPIMVGEPGVGKTAVVEGLAQKIVAGEVPDELKSVKLLVLDLGMLQAGAGVKGEFERRLKQVIDDVKASPIPIILFVDEAHTLIGAGGDAGTSDAANLLKPALARGELKTIAATTWSEYKQYFEKDAALERRFQLIKVEEPSESAAILMLSGLKSQYQQHHNIQITDDAIESAVRLSSRYITGRQLPDKAIDLLDTAAARIRMGQAVKPQSVDAAEEHIAYLNRRLTDMSAEQAAGLTIDKELQQQFETELSETEVKLTELLSNWSEQKELLTEIHNGKTELNHYQKQLETASGDESDDQSDNSIVSLKQASVKKRQQLKLLNNEQINIQPEVNADAIASVVSEWTGVPVGAMLKDEINSLMNLESILSESIIGQDDALQVIGQGLRVSKSGLKPSESPVGVFLLAGSSGIGKTETARAIARQLFGDERFMTTINMSEYQESHTVSQLKGSPPGYVGYGEGGVLTEAVRQRPYSVVLLDEVEKAHIDVMSLFYQVFERGFMRDGEGREIDFRNTIILMTTNLGSDVLIDRCISPELVDNHINGDTNIDEQSDVTNPSNIEGEDLALSQASNIESEDWKAPSNRELIDLIKPSLLSHFAPALIARMQVVPFRPLQRNELKQIVALKLESMANNLLQQHKMELRIDQRVLEQLADRCVVSDSGARMVNAAVEQQLMPGIARSLLSFMVDDDMPDVLTLSIDDENELQATFSDRQPGVSGHVAHG